jgi:hypothetical protein
VSGALDDRWEGPEGRWVGDTHRGRGCAGRTPARSAENPGARRRIGEVVVGAVSCVHPG